MTAAPVADEGLLESLVAQVVDEFLERLRRGEQPDPAEYAARHPHAAGVLREVLAALRVVGLSSSAGLAPASGAAVGDGPVSGLLGDFRILREVGRGGMGVVYEAEQISLGRRVALKVLPFAAAMDPKRLQRFQNEAQAAAHLHHTNIVPVHAVGCERGVHFYAMQFIDGHTLAAVIGDLRRLAGPAPPHPQPLSPEGRGEPPSPLAPPGRGVGGEGTCAESPTSPVAALSTERSTRSRAFVRAAANVGVQTAEALEHAHQLGVVHRDIKPANLMLDGRGHLWIADFGLARLGSDPGLTMTGDLVGTIRYMSPEQALGKRVPIDHRTDIYSLGVTLYELLTLERAYDGRTREEVLRQIAFEEPRPPRRLNPAVPAELETIVLKALAKNPEERYATAQELADDLRRFLEDKPIRARRPTLLQRARKWARRHQPVVWSAGVSAALLLLLALAALAVSNVRIGREKQHKEEALERERHTAYYMRIALAKSEANNLGRMQLLLDECPEDLRGWEWYYLKRLRYQPLPALRHDAAVLCAVFSPDGQQIASSDQDGWVKVWNAKTGQKVLQFRAHKDHARIVAFSPDGWRLATGGWDGRIKVWDAQALGPGRDARPSLTLEGPGGGVRHVAFSPDGRWLASASGRWMNSGKVQVWDATTGAPVFAVPAYVSSLKCLDFSPDGRRLVSVGRDPESAVQVRDARTGRELLTFRGHTRAVGSVAFSPDGWRIASAAGNLNLAEPEVLIWDARTGREIHRLRGHSASVWCLAFSPDGQRLATGSMDHTIKLWDVQTGREALTLRGHSDLVCDVAFRPDGHQLVSASHDRTVRVWDATPPEGTPDPGCLTLRGHRAGANAVAFHPRDRRLVASAGTDGTVRLWDVGKGEQVRTLRAHADCVWALAFSPDGGRLAAGGGGIQKSAKNVTVWDTTTWHEVPRSPLAAPSGLRTVAFSPDGRLLAAAGVASSPVAVWDLATGTQTAALHGHTWVVGQVAFRPDGRRIAAASHDGTVRVWDVTTGKEVVRPPLRHAARATAVAFSPDGGRLATASLDGTVRVWDATSWKPLLVRSDAAAGVWCVAFSPDGRRLAWGSTDATVKVADAATWEVLETLRGHTGWVQSVAFSPNGRQIASASADGTVKVWDTPGGTRAVR
jgi:WD40 repeat protein/serine/threonine protein kinase